MITNSKPNKLILIFVLFLFATSIGQVKLPRLVSDGMVLQRDAEVKIWGWASADEKVSVTFIDSTFTTSADTKGNWNIILPKMEAGGPYEMNITASNSITVNDIMIGEVWVCSGQSNMELPMRRVSWVYPEEIANSENNYIRHFMVPQKYNFKDAENDLDSGSWAKANPENILDFSAVAYFFAKELYKKYEVPIGLINSSLGGSPAQAWISEEALKEFPQHYEEAQKFKDDSLIKEIEHNDQTRIQIWYAELNNKDQGYKDAPSWWAPGLNTSEWAAMEVPGYWENTELGKVNGVVWFRKKVNVPSAMVGKKAKLILGAIVDEDSTFVNGVFVGNTTYMYPPRRYDIPAGLLKEGENTIVVRVVNNIGKGGFVLDKPYKIEFAKDTIDLKGLWRYRLGAEMQPLESQTFIRWKPVGLYNAMINPLINFTIKGAIWYQGESNTNKPVEYNSLFKTMIIDWRSKWDLGNFPFIFVQLASFMEKKNQPSESNWALLREAQLKTLTMPNTAMAVTIDIGEWNDIHPLNKKDVGKRLALAAEKIAYKEDEAIYSGPIYQSMKIEGNEIALTFTNTGSGLMAKGNDELKGFAVAGPASNFVWATAKIKDNKVIVFSDEVSNPVAVRYAWADNPQEANLYNREGLPASPFRTDD